MKYLCSNIQGCVLGYTQSDEITLILVDYQTLETDAWFDYEVQKMCSVSASMATMVFNKYFSANITLHQDELDRDHLMALRKAELCGAMFDARVFNIPKEEVTNLIYWRQLDAARNSVQMVGQAYFSQKQLHKKTCNMIQEMLHEQKGINWNDFPTHQKRGSCCIKTSCQKPTWVVDLEIPMFKGEDRNYIERLIHYED